MSKARSLADLISGGATIEASEIADSTITGGKLATDIAITTSGNITTTGALTSTGIDDNATSTAITIDSSERVGIGTASPVRPLHISSGASTSLQLERTAVGSEGKLILQSATSFNALYSRDGSDSDKDFVIVTGANERMRIRSDGSIGIGTSTPSALLNVVGSSNVDNTGTYGTTSVRRIIDINTTTATSANNQVRTIIGARSGNTVLVSDSQIEFQTNSTSTTADLTIDSSGNVGIGTSSPNDTANRVTLELNDTWGGRIRNSIGGTANSEWLISTSNMALFGTIVSQPLAFTTNNLERMRITSSGNVGIGTSSPSNNLDIVDSATGDIGINITNSLSSNGGHSASVNLISENANSDLSDATKGAIFVGGDLNGNNFQEFAIATESNTPIVFVTNGDGDRTNGTLTNERMRIDSSGNVGIGNTNPADFSGANGQNLVVGSGSGAEGMTIYSGTTADGVLGFADGSSGTDDYRGFLIYKHNGDAFQFGTSSSERMRLNSTGLGIGTTSPDKPLHVENGGTATNTQYEQAKFSNGSTVNDGNLIIGTYYDNVTTANRRSFIQSIDGNGSNRALLLNPNGGNVGIGTTSPTQKLDVNGVISSTSEFRLNNAYTKIADADAQGGFAGGYNINVSTNSVQHSVTGDAYGIHFSSSALKFHTDGSASGGTAVPERMRIDSSGNIGINTSSPSSTLDVNGSIRGDLELAPGKRYLMTSGAGTGTAIFDTNISLGSYGILEVFYVGNKLQVGSSAYRQTGLYYVHIGTGFSGSVKTEISQTEVFQHVPFGSPPAFTFSAVIFDGTNEVTSVTSTSGCQIRIKIAGYASSYTGAATNLVIRRIF